MFVIFLDCFHEMDGAGTLVSVFQIVILEHGIKNLHTVQKPTYATLSFVI